MPSQNIFVGQTTDKTVTLVDDSNNPIIINGIIRVDLYGTLDGASFTTSTKHTNSTLNFWAPIADGTWTPSDSPAFLGIDKSNIALTSEQVQFSISGAGDSTNLYATVSW